MPPTAFITAVDAGGAASPQEEKKDLKKLGSKARAFGGTFRRMTIQSCQMIFDATGPTPMPGNFDLRQIVEEVSGDVQFGSSAERKVWVKDMVNSSHNVDVVRDLFWYVFLTELNGAVDSDRLPEKEVPVRLFQRVAANYTKFFLATAADKPRRKDQILDYYPQATAAIVLNCLRKAFPRSGAKINTDQLQRRILEICAAWTTAGYPTPQAFRMMHLSPEAGGKPQSKKTRLQRMGTSAGGKGGKGGGKGGGKDGKSGGGAMGAAMRSRRSAHLKKTQAKASCPFSDGSTPYVRPQRKAVLIAHSPLVSAFLRMNGGLPIDRIGYEGGAHMCNVKLTEQRKRRLIPPAVAKARDEYDADASSPFLSEYQKSKLDHGYDKDEGKTGEGKDEEQDAGTKAELEKKAEEERKKKITYANVLKKMHDKRGRKLEKYRRRRDEVSREILKGRRKLHEETAALDMQERDALAHRNVHDYAELLIAHRAQQAERRRQAALKKLADPRHHKGGGGGGGGGKKKGKAPRVAAVQKGGAGRQRFGEQGPGPGGGWATNAPQDLNM